MIAVQATNYLNALPQNEQQFIGYFQCNIIFRVKDVLKKSFRDKGLKEEQKIIYKRRRILVPSLVLLTNYLWNPALQMSQNNNLL